MQIILVVFIQVLRCLGFLPHPQYSGGDGLHGAHSEVEVNEYFQLKKRIKLLFNTYFLCFDHSKIGSSKPGQIKPKYLDRLPFFFFFSFFLFFYFRRTISSRPLTY